MARLTDKQEGFVQSLLKGKTQRQAYKDNYKAGNMKDETIDSKACTLLKQGKVKARYDELHGKVRQKAEEEGLLSATQILHKLKALIERNEEVDDKTALNGMIAYGKTHGIFTEKVETVNTNLNIAVDSEEEARELLKAAGIDPDKL